MKNFCTFAVTIVYCLIATALVSGQETATESKSQEIDSRGVVVFEDDFERNELQEKTDEPGNGWSTNSKKRAKGNKQVDLKDGVMHIWRHEVADHGASVTHAAPFKDGSVEIRFMLENENDSLGLNFADLKFEEVHAGHLFKVTVGTKYAELADLKTGVMNKQTRELQKAGKLPKELAKKLKTKKKRFPNKLKTGQWYSAVVTVTGATLELAIDGASVGSFTSEGIAHPTKRTLRLAVAKRVVVDDLKVFARPEPAKAEKE